MTYLWTFFLTKFPAKTIDDRDPPWITEKIKNKTNLKNLSLSQANLVKYKCYQHKFLYWYWKGKKNTIMIDLWNSIILKPVSKHIGQFLNGKLFL